MNNDGYNAKLREEVPMYMQSRLHWVLDQCIWSCR